MLVLPNFISSSEIAFIVFILVIVFGADKIPEIAKGLGKGMRTLKNATNDIKSEVTKGAEEHLSKGSGKNLKEEITKVKDDIEEITGSIKRRN